MPMQSLCQGWQVEQAHPHPGMGMGPIFPLHHPWKMREYQWVMGKVVEVVDLIEDWRGRVEKR